MGNDLLTVDGMAPAMRYLIRTSTSERRWLMCCHHVGRMKNLFLPPPLLATADNHASHGGGREIVPIMNRQVRRGTEMHQAENVRSSSFGIIF